jgi:pyruvate-ferredoxin/flavodoxin oxidoreductase
VAHDSVKNSQLLEPVFEFSGACSGCGETPYLKLLTQLFGDRLMIANATGCSSIYGGNLPTTPYTTDRAGRGPAWSNSLFEDNAEFGLGLRLGVNAHRLQAQQLLEQLAPQVGVELAQAILGCDARDDGAIPAQRERIARLHERLRSLGGARAQRLSTLADYLVKKSVWLVGGDGWAYDIGFGGLDHVLSTGREVKILVLDTEVYSNTGGQQSKSTPRGAAAKFAVAGKTTGKKDLGLMALSYGHVYVARVAIGAKDNQTVRALLEAESYPGPALVIAYSHCIAHGYDMALGPEQQKLAVSSGMWPLYRYDPRRAAAGEPALALDSGDPTLQIGAYMRNEARFRMVEREDPARFRGLLEQTQREVRERWDVLKDLSARHATAPAPAGAKQ